MATWDDFTLVANVTGASAGSLTLAGVQKNDLIVTAAATSGIAGEVASIATKGVPTTKIIEKNSVPYRAYWHGKRWVYWWPYYYYYWYWYWAWWPWWYSGLHVNVKLCLYRADDQGDLTVEFTEPSGAGTIFSTVARAWRPSIAVGAGEEVSSVSFAESSQAPVTQGVVASLPVATDDLLLAIGVDHSPDYQTANVLLSGPANQELLDFFPVYANRSVRVKLWRIKSDTTAQLTYQNCYIGRMVQKLHPNVEVVQTAYPTPPEDVAYIEFQPELTTAGRVARPHWFEALRQDLAWSESFGLRKRWMREISSVTESEEGEPISRVRIIEMWKIPKGKLVSVPAGEAYVYDDEQTAEDRVTALDQGW